MVRMSCRLMTMDTAGWNTSAYDDPRGEPPATPLSAGPLSTDGLPNAGSSFMNLLALPGPAQVQRKLEMSANADPGDGSDLTQRGCQSQFEGAFGVMPCNRNSEVWHHRSCWACGWTPAPYDCHFCRQVFCAWHAGICFWCDEYVCFPHMPPRMHNCRCLPRN